MRILHLRVSIVLASTMHSKTKTFRVALVISKLLYHRPETSSLLLRVEVFTGNVSSL